ncbi:MAG: TolC family protein [Gemmataceae bacterium]|nr:TolC family protein [Gemmataceae bacterium]
MPGRTAWRALLFVLLATACGTVSGQHAGPGHPGKEEKGARPPETSPPAPPPALSLATLEQMAMQANPTLAQAAARVEMSRGKALQAGLPLNPTLAYQAEQLGQRGASAGEFQGVVISQELVTAGKLRLSRAKYEQEAVQAEIQAQAQELRVRNAVRLRYYDVASAQRVVEARTRLLQVAEEGLKATKQLVNVGAANRSDLLQAEVEERRARLDLKSARTRLEGEWARLAAVVGDPRLAQVPLDGQLEPDGPPPDWDKALCDLLDASPEMQFVRAEAVRDEITLAREQAEPFPNVRLQAGVGYNREARSTVADAQIGIRVPLFDRNQGTIRQAKAELARAYAEVRRMELSLRERFADAATRHRTARATAEEYAKEILPRAREAHALLLDSFRNRRAAWPQVLVAERTWAQLSVEYVEALHDLRKADVEIRGLLLTDGLAQPPAPTPQGHLDATPKPR